MHITININRTAGIALAVALGANAIGYVSQAVRPAFAQDVIYSPEVVSCIFRNSEKIQNVHSTSEPSGNAFAWLRTVCRRDPNTH